MVSFDANDFVTELAVGIVSSLGHKIGEPLRALKERKFSEELELAMWFNTYKLTESTPTALPALPSGFSEESLKDLLESAAVHAILHELLASRLVDAPEQDINRLRKAFQAMGARATAPWPVDYLAAVFDSIDYVIAGVVGKLEVAKPDALAQIRAEAHSSRITAILGAIERHMNALAGLVDPEVEKAYLGGYKRHIAEQYGVIEPPDFNHRRRVPIDDLYVSPEIIKVDESEAARMMGAVEPISVWRLADRIDRTVLLGDPGCGKTTASRVLMHEYVTKPSRCIPFLVTLREFAADDPPARSVVGYLERELDVRLQHPAPTGLINNLLLNGSSLVIFDGLDELLDPARRAEVSAIIERFCTEYPLVPVLVTSRLVGYDQARLDERQFTRYQISGFNDMQVAEYVHKWFAQEDGLTEAEANSWAQAFVEESESVADLRANPLMLALMCILYRGEGSIPHNRCDVYERCADLLFRRWDSHRRIRIPLKVARDSDAVIRRILQHLAFWLLTRDTAQTAVTEDQLVAETVGFLRQRATFNTEDEADEAAREFVEFCRGRAWSSIHKLFRMNPSNPPRNSQPVN